jgi:aminomethyltransferase
LLAVAGVQPIGLGARVSLRLEAGLCLYGHDIDETTTPLEAGLGWTISRARRPGGVRAGGYPGADIIEAELASGPARKRVGLKPEGRMPIREGAELLSTGGAKKTGAVTSGGFSPTLDAPIAMGYVDARALEAGEALHTVSRGRDIPMTPSKLPFVEHRYRR